MSFLDYRDHMSEPPQNSDTMIRAFREYMRVRYVNWTTVAGDNTFAGALSADLKKAAWEFDALMPDAAAARANAGNALKLLEDRYVGSQKLITLLRDGAEAWNFRQKSPKISDAAWRHIFHGESKGQGGNQTHVGLHSRVKIAANQHESRRPNITVQVVDRDGTFGVYKANVTIYTRPKASTMFPDTWSEPQIKGYVTEAARYWMISGAGASQKRKEYSGLVKWVGRCFVDTGDGVPRLFWIGGLGDPSTAEGVTTAFPEFRGSFLPQDE